MDIKFNNKHIFRLNHPCRVRNLKEIVSETTRIPVQGFYLLHRGCILFDDGVVKEGTVDVNLRLLGGKGGFGSMLRAIGAQIEKTTNREACRDLSGRRLRDINEEQRLKNWINQQAEREKEDAAKKQKKLERLCEQPKHEFRDEQYDKERSALPEEVESALLAGLEASGSSKRKKEPIHKVIKKKPKLWLDDELDSSDGDDSEDDAEKVQEDNNDDVKEPQKKMGVVTNIVPEDDETSSSKGDTQIDVNN